MYVHVIMETYYTYLQTQQQQLKCISSNKRSHRTNQKPGHIDKKKTLVNIKTPEEEWNIIYNELFYVYVYKRTYTIT